MDCKATNVNRYFQTFTNEDQYSVRQRIEILVEEWLEELCVNKRFLELKVQRRDCSAVTLVSDEKTGAKRLSMDNRMLRTKRWTENQAKAYADIFMVLSFVHQLHCKSRSATQREVYYCFANSFSNQNRCNEAILESCSLLNVSRDSLSLLPSARGCVAGLVKLHITRVVNERRNTKIIDCSNVGNNGVSIDAYWLNENSTTHDKAPNLAASNILVENLGARFILVIEKECIFQRVIEDSLFDRIPSIIITAKGFPDLATRACVRRLSQDLRLPVIGMADCNPYGLSVLLTYKIGSLRMGEEAAKYTVPLKWFGLRPSQLPSMALPSSVLQPMSDRDISLSKSLLRNPFVREHYEYRREIEMMLESRVKCELEALHAISLDYLSMTYTDGILRGDYI